MCMRDGPVTLSGANGAMLGMVPLAALGVTTGAEPSVSRTD